MHIEHAKGILHLAVVIAVLFKIHVIDRKLGLLEKRFTHK